MLIIFNYRLDENTLHLTLMRDTFIVLGYTIPKGWALMVVPAALQLNPKTYEDPLAFNPWRWQVG